MNVFTEMINMELILNIHTLEFFLCNNFYMLYSIYSMLCEEDILTTLDNKLKFYIYSVPATLNKEIKHFTKWMFIFVVDSDCIAYLSVEKIISVVK